MTDRVIALWNNQETFLDQCVVSVEDRSFLFGDGVYEVIRVYNGRAFLLNEHLQRLSQSMDAIGIAMPALEGLPQRICQNIESNKIKNGHVYLQVSRGTGAREHSANNFAGTPNELIYCKPLLSRTQDCQTGWSAILHPDQRWALRSIKSVNLLPNCLAKTIAHQQGAQEAILYDTYTRAVTEGSSTNVFAVIGGYLVTTPTDGSILPGITRQLLLERLEKSIEVNIQVRSWDTAELKEASEIFDGNNHGGYAGNQSRRLPRW